MGRVLVLEGIEKAERNVLPVLNNLLENREMHLEDGRLLIPAERYDKLLQVSRYNWTFKFDIFCSYLHIIQFGAFYCSAKRWRSYDLYCVF